MTGLVSPSQKHLRAVQDTEAVVEYLKTTCDPAISMASDPVHRPAHYRRGGYELIEVMEAWGLDADGYIMQAVQYLFRAGLKGSSKLEDYRKARYYLDRRITTMERHAQAQQSQEPNRLGHE